jgi:hypothetical protein
MKKCLEGHFSIPDKDSLHADLCSVGYKFDSAGRLVMESKDDISAGACRHLTRVTLWRFVSLSRKDRASWPPTTLIERSSIREAVMPEIKEVSVIIANPVTRSDTGRATIGFYTVSDGVLTMVDGDGKPVFRRHSGDIYTHELKDGDDPVAIAKRLTMSIWRSNTGGDASGGFNRRLVYNDAGIV